MHGVCWVLCTTSDSTSPISSSRYSTINIGVCACVVPLYSPLRGYIYIHHRTRAGGGPVLLPAGNGVRHARRNNRTRYGTLRQQGGSFLFFFFFFFFLFYFLFFRLLCFRPCQSSGGKEKDRGGECNVFWSREVGGAEREGVSRLMVVVVPPPLLYYYY